MDGFIFLNREIQDHWIFKNSDKFKFWCTLLFMANFKDNKCLMGNNLIKIKRGSFITSIENLSKRTLKSKDTIRGWLSILKKDGMIDLITTTKYTQIIICNYDTYQTLTQTNPKQTRQQIPNKSQTDPTQQNKDIKKEESIILSWRSDFKIYKNEMWSEYLKLVKDVDWLKNRQEYHPGLNIELSLKKSIEDFWSKDAGWENKKSAKIENINWKATFNNALTLKSNQVWKQKEKQEDKY